MSEYIYWSDNGVPLADSKGKLSLPRERIIRCRDCRHMHAVRHWLGMGVDECWLHAGRESGALGKERTEPDGFCAWGEEREAVDDA